MFDVRSHMCMCVRNPFWKVCAMCVRAARFQACHCHKSYIRRAICDHTFAHFLEQNSKKKPFFVLKTIVERPYPVLEHPFLLWYSLSCFRTSYIVSKQQQKYVEELLKKIWTWEVHDVCNPKNGRISPFHFCIDISWNCKCDFKIILAPLWLSANNIILGHQR